MGGRLQTVGPSSAAFTDTITGYWIGNGAAWTGFRAYVDAIIARNSLIPCNIVPVYLKTWSNIYFFFR